MSARSASSFRGLVLHEGDGEPRVEIGALGPADLPAEDVLVEVEYSSLNYKDALAVTGAAPIVRDYPIVPGIDLAGVVVESSSDDCRVGDRVIVTGWGVGEVTSGGMAEYARVDPGWVVPIPEGRDALWAMSLGTAGLTAMLAVMALERAGLTPVPGAVWDSAEVSELVDGESDPESVRRVIADRKPVLVTAASGGVGSIAVLLLSGAGHFVVASSGRHDSWPYLRSLGAALVLPREEFERPAGALEAQTWAGAVDSVGGATLARVVAETRYGGAVAACGLVGGSELRTTLMPFILRGVGLLGVNSVLTPRDLRVLAWERMARELPPDSLRSFTRVIPLEEVPLLSRQLVAGRGRGRTVVRVREE